MMQFDEIDKRVIKDIIGRCGFLPVLSQLLVEMGVRITPPSVGHPLVNEKSRELVSLAQVLDQEHAFRPNKP
jgi:hypothetical protein